LENISVPSIKGEKHLVLNSRTNKIVIKDSNTGNIKGELYTKETQFGTPNLSVKKNPALKTYGKALFYNGLSGSLTRLTDGKSYLIGGSGVTISSSSNGQITITAGAISPADTLTFGNGFSPYGTTYNGTASTSVAALAQSNGGISVASNGIKISTGNLVSTAAATTSWELIVSDGSTAYRSSISNILALGVSSGVTLTNPLTINSAGGIKDTLGGTQYDNTATVDLALKIESSKGLSSTSSGLKIDPSTLTSATVASSDKVVIGDVNDSDNVKYVTAQSIADLATVGTLPNSLAIGAGLTPSGSSFDGSSAIDLKVLAADSTVSVGSSGISVLKVPNSASNGNGIASFTFDGSSTATITAQATSNKGVQVTSDGIELDISSLTEAYPVTSDYLLIYDSSSSAERKTTINNFRTDIFLAKNNGFTGTANFAAGISGSLMQLSDGKSYLVAGTNIQIVSQSNGQIEISAVATPITGAISDITQANPGVVTTVLQHNLTEGQAVTITDVAGMTEVNGERYYADILTSGTFALYEDSDLTTSTDTSGFTAYVSGGMYTGAVSGGAASTDSPYVTWEADATFTNERIITGSNGIKLTNDSSSLIITTDPIKVLYNVTGSLPSSYELTIPGINFQANQYDYHKTDIYLNGNLLVSGSSADYSLGSGTSDIVFTFDLMTEDSLLFKLS